MSEIPPSSVRPHRGTLILVLGILGLVICQPLGIAAWIMSAGDLREMRSGRMDPTGESLTQAGRICGIIASVLFVLEIVIGFLMLVFMGFAATMN